MDGFNKQAKINRNFAARFDFFKKAKTNFNFFYFKLYLGIVPGGPLNNSIIATQCTLLTLQYLPVDIQVSIFLFCFCSFFGLEELFFFRKGGDVQEKEVYECTV